MATKTFEELRKLAIQIRDEKANKQNTALRIGNFLLSSLDKMESMDIADIAEAVLQAETAADEAKRQADIVAQSGDIVEEAIKQGAAAEAAAAAANAAADKATNEGLFKTQQDLSEEEQGQVKRNLGIEDLMASLETQTIEGFSETVNATTSTKSVDNIIPPSIDFAIVDLGSTDGRELPTTPSMSVVLAKVTDDGRVKMQGYLKTSHEEYNLQVVSGSAEKYALNVNIITDIETTYKVFQIRYLSSSDGGKFKGSYGQLSQLQTAYPTAGNGSYAFVGNPRHFYEWVTNAWTDRGEFITNVDQAIDAQSERAIANKAVTAKLTELESNFSLDIDKSISDVSGWSSLTKETVSTKIFGTETEIEAQKVSIIDHTGNTLAFNSKEIKTEHVGQIINVSAMIYSPINTTFNFRVYTPSGGEYEVLSNLNYKIKAGINFLWLSLKIKSVVNEGIWQFYFKDTTLINEELYIVSYFYTGARRNLFMDIITPRNEAIENSLSYANQLPLNTTYHLREVENWYKDLITRNVLSNVFGQDLLCTKIIKHIVSEEKPLANNFNMRFFNNTDSDYSNLKIGDIVSLNFSLFVSKDTNIALSIYSNGKNNKFYSLHGVYSRTEDNNFVRRGYIKQGITNISVSYKIEELGNYAQIVAKFEDLLEGDEIYILEDSVVSYKGVPCLNPKITDFVKKEEGKGLSSNDFSDNYKEKIDGIEITSLLENIASPIDKLAERYLTKEIQSDGSIKLSVLKGALNNQYAYFNLPLKDISFKKNHSYYFAMDMIINKDTLTEGGTSTGGNFYGSITPKYNDGNKVGDGQIKQGVVHNTRGLLKADMDVNSDNIDTYPTAKNIFFQFGRYGLEDSLEAIIYNVICVDLGEKDTEDFKDWNYVDSLITSYGLRNLSMVSNAENAINAERAKVADSVKELAVGKEIDFWGNSLTAQDYAQYVEQILGRKCFPHGYGGKKSTYIRDEFLKNVNKERTQVIWVGRNNASETDVVIDDIRDMVEGYGGNDFIIMNPPNGNYGTFGESGDGNDGTGEMKGGTTYQKFIELTEKLKKEYPSNFLDIREAIIFGWRMGNIKLLEAFIQPNAGENVTIKVSDADFLTTYNSNDEGKFGTDFMSHIRIGINGKYDKYKVISKEDINTLVVQLVNSDSYYKSPGSTVENITDDGGNSAIKYLRVMQEADYQCYVYDTTLSTFRSDGIHMKEEGKKLVAEIVARKIVAMKI